MKTSKIFSLLYVIASFLFFIGCDNESITNTTPKDPAKAKERVTQANQILIPRIAMISSNQDPSTFDLSSANALYNEALQYDPTNLDAHFGAAITGVLTLFSDTTIRDLGSGNISFPLLSATEIISVLQRGDHKRISRLVENISAEDVQLLFQPSNSAAKVLAKSNNDNPLPSYFQNIVETKVLPVFIVAIQHLQQVTLDQDYAFLITPEMTGGADETTYRIDLTEIYLLLSLFQYIDAYGSIFVSYNIDYNSSAAASVIQAWTTGSPYLALRTNGTQHMKTARSNIVGAATSMKNGFTFLMNEPPHQEMDIIKYNPNEQQYYLNTIQSANETIAMFSGPSVIENGITVNLVNFFDSPISDFKTKLPAYTVTAQFNGFSGRYDAVLTWGASTYDTWVFPDPTFNGVLPEMTNQGLKQLLDINAATWQRSLILPG